MREARVALLLLLASCGDPGGNGDAPAATRDTLIRVTEDEIKSLDPQKISDLTSLRVASALYEGLTRHSAAGRIEPGLAAHWSASADGLTWRFVLRPDLRFSDGAPIDAETAVDSLRRLLAPATAAPNATLFATVQAIEASDRDTVVLRLSQPFPAILELLAHPSAAVLPIHRIAADPDGWMRAPVSSGPYRLARWQLHSRLDLAANPAYWDAGNVRTKRVAFLPIDDDQTAIRRFRAGEAHTVGDFPASQLAPLRERLAGAVRIAPYRGSYYWVFNTRKPPFDDPRVRRALSMAVDRGRIVDKLLGQGNPPAYGVVPPGLGGYGTAVRPAWAEWPIRRRLAEARRLLAAAGYGPDRPLVVEARFNSDVDHRRVGIALASFWKPLGVELRLFNTEATLHFAALKTGDFALARSGWIGDLSAAENFLAIHRSDAGALNYSGYRSARFDRALDVGLSTASPAARNAALARAEAILVEDSPVLPLYFYVSKNLVSPCLEGWTDNWSNVHVDRTLALTPGCRFRPR
jgi:peptide/nickel transport system substrate-binding protein/oligopeptide transport system substrate-binding protein